MECSSRHKNGAFTVTGLVMLLSILATAWIKYDSQENILLKDVEFNLTCATCAACLCAKSCNGFDRCNNISLQRRCRERGWRFHWAGQIPKKCASDQEFIGQASKQVEKEYQIQSQSLKKGLHTEEVLEDAVNAFIDPCRYIFHWFPHCWNRGETTDWTNLSDYERDVSTYTISTGPSGSCEKDTFFIIPETGLYNIYGKITFACDQADHKGKRVRMKVDMIGNVPNEPAFTLLSGEDENTCWMSGDLVTLYQSGLFRMMKGNKIFLKYKAPKGVRLSSKQGSPFRSSFGAYRVGLA